MSRRLTHLPHIFAKFILLLLLLATVTHFSSHKAFAALNFIECKWQADSQITCTGGDGDYRFYLNPQLTVQYSKPIFQLTKNNGQTTSDYVAINADGSQLAVSNDPANFPEPSESLTDNGYEKKRKYAERGGTLETSDTWTGSVAPDGLYTTLSKRDNTSYYMVCGLFSKPSEKCWIGPNTSGDPVLLSSIDPSGEIDKLNQILEGVIKSSQQCEEDSGVLSFIFCPLLRSTQDAVTKLTGTSEDGTKKGYLLELLTIKPLDNSPAAENSAKNIYLIWESFRNIAMGLYTLVFILIIFGNGLGFDNYQIKKALPKLAAGSLMTFASFFIVQTLVDLSNALGNAIPSFIGFIAKDANVSDFKIDLAGAGQAVGIVFLILFALAALVAVIVGIAGLITRQIIIYILIMVAPLAFVAWVFPNTQNLFKKWWSNLIKVCMMFPIITSMIAFSILFTKTLDQSSSATLKLAATVAPLIALIMIPKTFKWGGDAFAATAGFVAGYATKGVDRGKSAGKGLATSGVDRAQDRISQTKFGESKLGGFVTGAGVGALVGTKGSKLRRMSQLNRISSENEKAVSYDYENTMARVAAQGRAQGLTDDQITENKNRAFSQLVNKAPSQNRALYAKRAAQGSDRGQIQIAAAAMGQQNYEEFVSRNFSDFDNMSDLRNFNVASQPLKTPARELAIRGELAKMSQKALLSGNASSQKEWYGSYDAATGVATPQIDNIRAIDTSTLYNALGDRSNRVNLTPATIKSLLSYAHGAAAGDSHASTILTHLDTNGNWQT